MEEEEADVEARVREALRLLEDDGDGDSEEELENREWRTRASAGHFTAFDNEVVEENWMLGAQEEPVKTYSRSMDGLMGSKKEENREEEAEKEKEESDKKSGKMVEMETNMTGDRDDKRQLALKEDWQEAYTAKGHVYCYNRFTRESLWKKPNQYDASTSQPQMAAAATEQLADPHSSVLEQSFEDHLPGSGSTLLSMEHQTTLYCCFCGEQQLSDQYAAHFQQCTTACFHKQRLSPLYASFERALVLMSEDATLRSVHYAASFPDPTPCKRPEATSVQDSLLLLHSRLRRSTNEQHITTESIPQKSASYQDYRLGNKFDDERARVKEDASSALQSACTRTAERKKESDVKRKSDQPTRGTFVGMPVTPKTETCRYCNRSFAEGRLSKHEAVCPRVFGRKGSWGRGASSYQVSPQSRRSGNVETPLKSTGSMTSSMHKLKDHTLQQSYIEHKATLVLCPCCRRKFAPSGVQQHIAICKGVQNRPRNSFRQDCTIAG
uniref:WW domain-containing protein n=1 Tax=Peronospora matthiolae TaxID=2874970 RepID=A0AAV1T5K3_9STRA